MVSDATRNAVWQSYLDVARLVYYYDAQADRYQRFYIAIRFAMLFFVIVSVASPFAPFPQPIDVIAPVALILVTAVLVTADYVGDFAKKAAVLHGIAAQVHRLGSECRALWLRIDDADSEDGMARRKNEKLQNHLTETTEQAREAGITINNKLNQECVETAYAIVEDRHRYDLGEASSYAD